MGLVKFLMKAKKSFGQHFLINEGMSADIASSLQMTGDIKNVLEIGPGKGVPNIWLNKIPISRL